MDRVLGWFLVACLFAGVSTWLALSLWFTRRRAQRAEGILDRILLESSIRTEMSSGSSERSLDAIANEVERIGEGQRFLTKTLLERSQDANVSARSSMRVVTPH
ncbi:MAG: hypothetical protein IBJ03_02175 [Gemmatimonadaceae bacterium]|nr:hypothetical protein [Gemmatimonadaceae bacterium]